MKKEMLSAREDFIRNIRSNRENIPYSDLQAICMAQEFINGWDSDELLTEITA